MAIKYTAVKCPVCGANLQAEEGTKKMVCMYCESEIAVSNDNEKVVRTINEAELKNAETEQMIRLRQIEIEERREAEKRLILSLKLIISLILGVVGVLLIIIGTVSSSLEMLEILGFFPLIAIVFIWLITYNERASGDSGDKIRVPSAIEGYKFKNYASIEALLASARFTNIKCVPLNDLTFGIIKKPGIVESITIDGTTVTSGGGRFLPDAKVVISYHSRGGIY